MFDQIHHFFGEIDQVTHAMRAAADVQMRAHADLTASHRQARDAVGALRPAFRGAPADAFFQSQRHSLALGRLALQHLEQHAGMLNRWAGELEGLRHEHLGLLLGIVNAVPGLDLLLDFLGNHFTMPSLDAVARMGPDALSHPLSIFDSLVYGGGGGVLGGLSIEGLLQGLADRGLGREAARAHVGRFGDQLRGTAAAVREKQVAYKAQADGNGCASPWVPDQNTFKSQARQDGKPEPYKAGPPHNMQQLYAMIEYQYHRDDGKAPIGITQVGNDTLLVTLAGVELGHPDRVNNIGDAIDKLSQENNPKDAYEQDVERALTDYIKNHKPPLKQPVRLILAGHSYGGAVAEEMAATDNNNGMWRITDVTTFGSPEIGSEKGTHVNYRQYFTAHDIVPLASGYVYGSLVRRNQAAGPGSDPSAVYNEPYGEIVGANIKGDLANKALLTAGDAGNSAEIGLNDNTLSVTNVSDAHGAYMSSDQLKQTGIPGDWNIGGKNWGPTQYYFVSTQADVGNLYDPQTQKALQGAATPTPSSEIGPGNNPTPTPKR